MRKLSLLFILTCSLTLLVIYGCRNESTISSTETSSKEKVKLSLISKSKILENGEAKKAIDKFRAYVRSSTAKNVQDSVLDGAIIKTENVILAEVNGHKTYTIPVSRTYENSKIENLVLKKNSDDTFSGILVQYQLTHEEKLLYLAGKTITRRPKVRIFEVKKLNTTARTQIDIVGCYRIVWETGKCASGEHDYGNDANCVVGGAAPPDIMSIDNICEGGGTTSGGTTTPTPGGASGSIGDPGGFGGDYVTFPYNGVPTELELRAMLGASTGYANLPYAVQDFIADNYLIDFNLDFAYFSANYFTQNPNVTIDLFKNYVQYNKISIDNQTGDIEYNNSGQYDYTSIENYDLENTSKPWPTIAPVIPINDFVGYNTNLHPAWQCFQYADAQLRKMGYTISGYYELDSQGNKQRFNIYTEQNGVNFDDLYKGVDYLIKSLSKGVPVAVGVDDRAGSPGNLDKTTDHFIVIVGMGTDANGRYFQFYDNA